LTPNSKKVKENFEPTHLGLEEYGVSFEYLPGKKNVVADALSRVDIDDLQIQE
jgi:hypothetical protein